MCFLAVMLVMISGCSKNNAKEEGTQQDTTVTPTLSPSPTPEMNANAGQLVVTIGDNKVYFNEAMIYFQFIKSTV